MRNGGRHHDRAESDIDVTVGAPKEPFVNKTYRGKIFHPGPLLLQSESFGHRVRHR